MRLVYLLKVAWGGQRRFLHPVHMRFILLDFKAGPHREELKLLQ